MRISIGQMPLSAALVMLVLISALRAANAQSAYENPVVADIRACTFTHPVRTVGSAAELPQPIRKALGKIAELGEPFNATDMISANSPPGRRFIRAGQWGELYFVWYEQGGIAYAPFVSLYRLRAADNGIELLAFRPQFADCHAIDDLLDGKPSPRR